jgi:hypothetical protein
MPGPHPVSCFARRRGFVNAWCFVGVLLFAGPAQAQNAPPPPAAEDEWRCWYTAPAHVTCAAALTDSVPGSKHKVQIPLHAVPFDMAGVERLTRSVICRSRSACVMRFGPLEPLELDQLLDPLWAAAD